MEWLFMIACGILYLITLQVIKKIKNDEDYSNLAFIGFILVCLITFCMINIFE